MTYFLKNYPQVLFKPNKKVYINNAFWSLKFHKDNSCMKRLKNLKMF